MKYALTALVFMLTASALQAGVVSLTPAEILRFRKEVAVSPAAADWARSIEQTAQKDLKEVPDPVDQIQTAGQLKGSIEKKRTQKALKDISRLENLEWAYALTGQAVFEEKARDYVVAWAQTCHPPTNPINATHLETLIETYDLIRSQMDLSDRQLVDQWLQSVANTLFASDHPQRDTHWNNWQAHRLKIIGMVAFALGNPSMEHRVLDDLKTFMDKNLNPDGTTFDFLERDALHYHVYDLEPMIRTAILFQRGQGIDLYHWRTPQDASISKCVDFLIPYAEGEKTHAEFVHTKVKFDIERAENHEKGYVTGVNFPPQEAEKCLALAQFFQPDLRTLVGTLTGREDSPYPSFQILINEVTRPTTAMRQP